MNSDEKIFIAGSTGMVGSSIKKTLIKKFYGRSYYLWTNIEIINRGV